LEKTNGFLKMQQQLELPATMPKTSRNHHVIPLYGISTIFHLEFYMIQKLTYTPEIPKTW